MLEAETSITTYKIFLKDPNKTWPKNQRKVIKSKYTK